MARRHGQLKTGARRRALVVGAIPLALAVGCAATDQNAASPNTPAATGAQDATPANPQDGTPGGPQTARTPTANPPSADSGRSSGDAARQPGLAGGAAPRAATSPVQPGVTAPATDRPVGHTPGPIQPGVTTPPTPAPAPNYLVPPNYRPIPAPEAAPAIDLGTLHAPVPVEPVAPIAPPPRTLRVGAFTTPVPDDVPDAVLNPVNGGAAAVEAGIATGLNSVGIHASRSDKIAAGTIAGTVIGATAGALAAGIPAAAVGLVPGAVIGTGIGAATGAVIGGIAAGIPTSGAASLPGAGAGALIGAGVGAAAGAAVGAAALGIPAAIVGGVAGGALGFGIGSAYGAVV